MIGFFVVGRYRVAWFPWVAVGGAHGFTLLARAYAARNWRAAAPLGAGIIVVAAVAIANGPRPTTARSHFLRDYDLHVAGRPDLALAEYDRVHEMALAAGDGRLAAEIAYNRAAARSD